MSDSAALPPTVSRVLDRFRAMGREEKMQALVSYAKRLEPLPERFRDLDRAAFTVPECQTRVDLFPELRDGKLHFYADLEARQSPTIAAFLAILFSAVNDQPPEVTLAIPGDFVTTMMEGIGLHTRELGLNAMVQRLKRHAREALAVEGGGGTQAARTAQAVDDKARDAGTT
ncbi:MAG TPA: SufE family protein [Gemmatimonadales bacterium]